MTVVSEVLTASGLVASETSVNFYQTARRNIPEDSHLQTVMCSYFFLFFFIFFQMRGWLQGPALRE
jgi:hypothetical protein